MDRAGDRLYTTYEPVSENDLEGILNVNSAGYFSRQDEPQLEWKKYIGLKPKQE